MEHATRISAEDQDARIERAKRQRDVFIGDGGIEHERFDIVLGFIEQLLASSFHGFSSVSVVEVMKTGVGYASTGAIGAFNFLRPTNLKTLKAKGVERLRQMTYGQLLITSFKLSFSAAYNLLWFIYFVIR